MRLNLLLLVATLLRYEVQAAICHHAFSAKEFVGCQLLSPALALHWRLEGDGVTFAVDLDGSWNWVGLGVSEAGGMFAADMAIAKRDPVGGSWSIGDYWSTDTVEPSLDTNTQDAVLLSASQSAGATRLVFWRPLDTCDEREDSRIIHGVTHYLIFAYGLRFGNHGPERRGTAQIELLPLPTPSPAPAVAPSSSAASSSAKAAAVWSAAAASAAAAAAAAADGAAGGNTSDFSPVVLPGPTPGVDAYWELRMDAVEIPARDTTYSCRHFQLPIPETKVHVASWEAIVEHPRNVHHMIIYACSRPPATPRQLYDCMAMDGVCQSFYILWAPGGLGATAPEAGFAFGGDSGITWVSLQVHYTNLELESGVVDRSGFRLHATTALRPHDMGVLALGSLDFSIPGGRPSYSSAPNLCPKACTQRLPRPLTLVGSGFHMHTLGRRIKTQWARSGAELAPLGERKAFHFDYQGATPVDPSHSILLPGDELITTCTWDSTSRVNRTRYGESTSDEMCLNFLFYYPRVPGLEVCTTLGSRIAAVSACTTMDRGLGLLEEKDATKQLAKLLEMQTSGELVFNAPLGPYKPFNRTCAAPSVPKFAPVSEGGSGSPPVQAASPPPARPPVQPSQAQLPTSPPPKPGSPPPKRVSAHPPPRRQPPRRNPPRRATRSASAAGGAQ